MRLNSGFYIGFNRLQKFYSQVEIRKASNAVLKKYKFLCLILKAFDRLLPDTLFGYLVTVFWLLFDRSYTSLYSKGEVSALLPTSNNRKVFSRVFDIFDAQLEGFGKDRVSFLDRLKVLISEAFFLLKFSSNTISSDLGTRLQLARYASAYCIFSRNKNCKLSVVANDHSPVCVAFSECCRSNGAKTLYIQHGSVSDLFPPLDFDFTIVFNKKSLEVYNDKEPSTIATHCRILSPFREDFYGVKDTPNPEVVCISLGVVPNFLFLEKLVAGVEEKFTGSRILFRPHPRINNYDFKDFLTKFGFDSANVFTGDDWSEINIHLAGNSGVHLDALHHGIPSLYLNGIDSIVYDYYGFIKDGVVFEYDVDMLSAPDLIYCLYDGSWLKAYSYYDETVVVPIKVQEENIRRFLQSTLAIPEVGE